MGRDGGITMSEYKRSRVVKDMCSTTRKKKRWKWLLIFYMFIVCTMQFISPTSLSFHHSSTVRGTIELPSAWEVQSKQETHEGEDNKRLQTTEKNPSNDKNHKKDQNEQDRSQKVIHKQKDHHENESLFGLKKL